MKQQERKHVTLKFWDLKKHKANPVDNIHSTTSQTSIIIIKNWLIDFLTMKRKWVLLEQ